MTYSMLGIQAGLQSSPLELGSPASDLQARFIRPRQHQCGQDGNCGPGQKQGLDQASEGLVQAGEQIVQVGQRLIEQGDFQQGMQLTRNGLNLKRQGLQFEQQAQQGNDPSMSPYGPTGDNFWSPNEDQYAAPSQNYGGQCGCGWNKLAVNGNSVDTGRFTITASTDGGGSLEVKDNTTGKSFKVWGDPHITTDKGDTADFQHAPATFKLPDGTELTVNPTHNSGVNYIDNVTITKGNNAATMTGFQGNLQTQALPGEGRQLDRATPDGTVLTAENGQIDELMLPDGTEIKGNVKNIDGYAFDQTGGNLAQLRQAIAGLEQEISEIERGITMTSLSTTGFMANLL